MAWSNRWAAGMTGAVILIVMVSGCGPGSESSRETAAENPSPVRLDPRRDSELNKLDNIRQVDRSSLQARDGSQRGRTGPRIRKGESARPFSGEGLQGETVKLSDYSGRYVLLDFWATWCKPCLVEMPHIQRIVEKHGGNRKFAIVGISLDRDRKAVESFVRDHKINYPQIFDGRDWNSEVARLYGVVSIPFTVLIGPDGKVVETNLRGAQLETTLDRLLGG